MLASQMNQLFIWAANFIGIVCVSGDLWTQTFLHRQKGSAKIYSSSRESITSNVYLDALKLQLYFNHGSFISKMQNFPNDDSVISQYLDEKKFGQVDCNLGLHRVLDIIFDDIETLQNRNKMLCVVLLVMSP